MVCGGPCYRTFANKSYNQSEMTRAVEGDADSGVRKGFGDYPEKKYSDVVDAIIKEYKEK